MTTAIRYAHTNLIARDWEWMRDFYCEVFGCEPVGGERDHKGPLVEALTGVPGAHVRGRHLRLPGHGEAGPTLEVFQYHPSDSALPPSLTRPGFAHLAFEVPDLAAKREEIRRWGGRDFGQLVTLDIAGAGKLTVIYMCDPEGNIVELQSWT